GPAFSATPFDAGRVTLRKVGTVMLTFNDSGAGVFSYRIGTNFASKPMAMLRSPGAPSCTWGAQPTLSISTNFDGFWWASPAGVESGWGLNLTHRADGITMAWMTYDDDGSPMSLFALASPQSNGAFGGAVSRATSSGLVPFGTVALSFSDGNKGTFTHTISGVSRIKPITRFVFEAPG